MSEVNKGGRPSKYDPVYCQLLVDHMTQGLSLESFAAVIDVSRETLYEWQRVHPEFSDTVKAAKDKCLIFWERQGIEGLYSTTEYDEKGKPSSSKSINASVWIFNMKNRFRDQWHDKQQIEHSGSIQNTPDEELDAKIAGLMAPYEKKEG